MIAGDNHPLNGNCSKLGAVAHARTEGVIICLLVGRLDLLLHAKVALGLYAALAFGPTRDSWPARGRVIGVRQDRSLCPSSAPSSPVVHAGKAAKFVKRDRRLLAYRLMFYPPT